MASDTDLREALRDNLYDRIVHGDGVTEDGQVIKASASVLGVAVNYLKTFAESGKPDVKAEEIAGYIQRLSPGKMKFGGGGRA